MCANECIQNDAEREKTPWEDMKCLFFYFKN